MALFKILKGAGNLPSTKTEGWAYVKKTGTDSADFFVDYDTSSRLKINKYADEATKWKKSITVSFDSGDVLGDFTFDGGGDISGIDLQVKDDSHNHIISNIDGLADELALAKKSAGSADTSSKIFLVGATSQATTAQTYSHDTVYVDTSGNLNTNALMINTTGTPSIKFASTGYNYLLASANSSLAFCTGSSATLGNSGLVVNSTGAIPGVTDKFNLGTSSYRWNNIVGKTLTGDYIKGGQVSGSIILEVKPSTYTSSIAGHIWIST